MINQGYTYSVTVQQVGSATNLPGIYETKITNFVLYDSAKNDVTSRFKINFAVGYLQIYIKEITVQTMGGSKEYDGTPLTADGYFIEGDLVSGHILKSLVCTGSQTNVGKRTNTFTISIVDADGINVTDHYKINRVCATLEVTAKKITITAGSATKSYDGTALTNSGYTVEGDTDGYTVDVSVYGSQTNIGRSDNKIQRVVIKDSSGKDVTLNFAIECNNGWLIVTPATN